MKSTVRLPVGRASWSRAIGNSTLRRESKPGTQVCILLPSAVRPEPPSAPGSFTPQIG